jgi:hypothetical protein
MKLKLSRFMKSHNNIRMYLNVSFNDFNLHGKLRQLRFDPNPTVWKTCLHGYLWSSNQEICSKYSISGWSFLIFSFGMMNFLLRNFQLDIDKVKFEVEQLRLKMPNMEDDVSAKNDGMKL